MHLPEVIQEALDLVRPLAQERSITIAGLSGECDFFVKADRQRLRQVLLNLLANGVKYNVDGGRIALSVGPNGYGAIRTSVSDLRGPGSRAEERQKLFPALRTARG